MIRYNLILSLTFITSAKTLSMLCAKSYPTLCDPMDCVSHQAPLSMKFSRQEYWSGWPFPSPGDLSTWIEPMSPVSPALAGRFH